MKKIYMTIALIAVSCLLPAQEIDITGKNISIINNASVSTANNNTYFGEQISASGSISKTFVIANTGTANLVLSGNPIVTVNNADFSVTSMPVSPVLPGQSTSFVVRFDPSTNAVINATLSIANNDANENPYTFKVSGMGLASRTVRWVNNTGAIRPATVNVNGDTYSTAATTYTNIQLAVNAAGSFDIVYVTNGRYMNPAEATSTNCVIGGLGQDPALYININKPNLIITSETGDYRTSSAKLIGYSLNLTDTIGNVTIQGLMLDSVRQNAIYNSDYVFLSTSLNTPNVRIHNNKITNVRGHGIKTDTRSAFVIDRGMWEINGNYFENIGFYNGSANCVGTLSTSAIWLGEAGSSCEIMNNTINNAKWGGILCIGFGNPDGSTNGGVTIVGNKINTTGNSGIQVGWTTTGGFYFPNKAFISNNFIQNANTSQALGIGAISMVQSNSKNVSIIRNQITTSYNGITIQVAGWSNVASDTTRIQFNNFCNLVTGSYAIGHYAGISPNGLFGTPDNLFRYKCDNNYYGSSSGPTYSSNPGGTGEGLKKETGANAFYSANDFNYFPFKTSANNIPVANPGAISGAVAMCVGANSIYSVAPVAGATSYSWSLPGGWTGTSTTNIISVTTGTATGNISVLVANSCGSTAATSVSVTVNPLPVVAAASSSSLICEGETATITASGATGYLWSNTSNTSTITVSPTTTTSYTVTGSDVNGCTNTATVTQNVSACVGITKLKESASLIQVYPNPNNGRFTIAATSDITLTVTNQLGQVIKKIALNKSNNHTALITELSNGVYFVSGENEHTLFNKKIIVNQ